MTSPVSRDQPDTAVSRDPIILGLLAREDQKDAKIAHIQSIVENFVRDYRRDRSPTENLSGMRSVADFSKFRDSSLGGDRIVSPVAIRYVFPGNTWGTRRTSSFFPTIDLKNSLELPMFPSQPISLRVVDASRGSLGASVEHPVLEQMLGVSKGTARRAAGRYAAYSFAVAALLIVAAACAARDQYAWGIAMFVCMVLTVMVLFAEIAFGNDPK